MELEALLLGIEPLTALAVGVGAVVLAPVVGALNAAAGPDSKAGESIAESARDLAKNGLVWGFDAVEQAQTIFAQAEESFRDLVSDAKVEHAAKKSQPETPAPHNVEIVSE
jgi:hypothetical protein